MNEIAFEDIEQHAQQLGASIGKHDWEPTLKGDVRKLVLQGVRDNFTSSVSPDGRQWPARKRKGDGHPLLIDTGAMLQAATGGGSGHVTQIDGSELTVGVSSTVPYAAIHNEGKGKMPKREFMGVQEKRLKQIDKVIADAGLEIFK